MSAKCPQRDAVRRFRQAETVENDGTFTRCPYCREVVSPDDPTAVYAVERVEMIAMGPTRHIADGLGGYFHAGCSPEAVGYERRPRPDTT